MSIKENLRVHQIKAMNAFMIECNEGSVYEEWLLVINEEPTEEQLHAIACEDELYNEIFTIFIELISKKGFRY